ncbi:hypothetical protein Pcinc_029720 [Petrolisthes cinctipes]|uniref:Uncharacterized protein n=1 Tax=Petrolisthes cinctipes TaxID=88211 RepID=A0AAE1F0D6_PETCI|nr:hypothetical protein Pcinc_029720 [Petrolisthes cinctipes]
MQVVKEEKGETQNKRSDKSEEISEGVLDIGCHHLGHDALQVVHPFLVLLKTEIVHVFHEAVVLLPKRHLAVLYNGRQAQLYRMNCLAGILVVPGDVVGSTAQYSTAACGLRRWAGLGWGGQATLHGVEHHTDWSVAEELARLSSRVDSHSYSPPPPPPTSQDRSPT